VCEAIDELTHSLRHARLANPRGIASDVIAAVVRVDRSWPALNRDHVLDIETLRAARAAAAKLAMGAPFAYAVGTVGFRHLVLEVDERALIPRPETEVLVEEILGRLGAERQEKSWGVAADIGTGSGAIALALATEGRFDRVIGTDSSLDALAVARGNVDRLRDHLRTPVELRAGSLIAPVNSERVRLLVSNPPYVAYSEVEALPRNVRDWEPPTALLSGGNGLAITAAIVQGGASILEPGGMLALEVDERRASLVAELVMASGNYIAVAVGLDLTGRERFVFASRT
jgi:release factor glutamine methyltransferase